MNTLITNPRAHREVWVRQHPSALIEHGGLLSREDLARWACDICMAPLDPGKPIHVAGGPEGHSLCDRCWNKLPASERAMIQPCACEGCIQYAALA